MVFVDVGFYQDKFLKGRVEIIPFSEFEYWAEIASDRINWRGIEISEEQIIPQLKKCTCEVAEALYVNSEKEFMAMEPSQSVGAYSKGAVNVKQEQSDFESRINKIITRRLFGTTLHNQFVWLGA